MTFGNDGSTVRTDRTRIAELPSGPIEYRLERGGPGTVLMLHGGHMRADIQLGEGVFTDAGHTVLAPSRPGYGATPLSTGSSPDGFANTIAELCQHLGIGGLAAVIGQSAGGPTAIALAARHPGLVERLILQSAVGLLAWPDRRTRIAAAVVFNPRTERFTWSLLRALARTAPRPTLRLLMRDLTTRPVAEVVDDLCVADRAALIGLFSQMRSGHGFTNDIAHLADPRAIQRRTVQATGLHQPAMIIATRQDGAVRYSHAQSIAAAVPDTRLITSTASTHLIWHSEDYPDIENLIRGFLDDPAQRPDP